MYGTVVRHNHTDYSEHSNVYEDICLCIAIETLRCRKPVRHFIRVNYTDLLPILHGNILRKNMNLYIIYCQVK